MDVAHSPPFISITAGLTSYLSMVYQVAKLSELLAHRLVSAKCVVAGISGCSDILPIKRVAKEKKFEKKLFRSSMGDITNRTPHPPFFITVGK